MRAASRRTSPVQKLYIGREHGIELSGAIASNQRMMHYMPGMPGGPGSGSKAAPGALHAGHGGPLHAWGGAGTLGGGGQVTKLPPLKQQQSLAPAGAPQPFAAVHQPHLSHLYDAPHHHHHHAGGAVHASGAVSDGEAGHVVRRAHSSTHLGPLPSSGLPHAGSGRDVSPMSAYGDPHMATSRSEGQPSPDAQRTSGGNAQYAHVQSKFAQDAMEKSMMGKQANRRAKSGRAANKGKPDRFAEAERENARVAGMGRRWN